MATLFIVDGSSVSRMMIKVDALTEIFNHGVGLAAQLISELAAEEVKLGVPQVDEDPKRVIADRMPQDGVGCIRSVSGFHRRHQHRSAGNVPRGRKFAAGTAHAIVTVWASEASGGTTSRLADLVRQRKSFGFTGGPGFVYWQ